MTDSLLKVALLGAEWVMYLLLALSVWSIAVMIERFVFFRKHAADVPRLIAALGPALDRHDWAAAQKTLEGDPSIEASVLRDALREIGRGPEAVEDTLSASQLRERSRTERGLTLLGTLGNNAPFVGLLGTVLGIIQAFHTLASNPQGGAAGVMAGISEALVATAVGLFVALPAVIGFNYFGRRASAVGQHMQSLGHMLLARCRSGPVGGAS
jgi:biopolymer transport protein ExbB/TolQ